MVAGDAATLGRMGDKAGKRGETPAGQVMGPGAPRKAQGSSCSVSSAEDIRLDLEIVRGQVGCPRGSG